MGCLANFLGFEMSGLCNVFAIFLIFKQNHELSWDFTPFTNLSPFQVKHIYFEKYFWSYYLSN